MFIITITTIHSHAHLHLSLASPGVLPETRKQIRHRWRAGVAWVTSRSVGPEDPTPNTTGKGRHHQYNIIIIIINVTMIIINIIIIIIIVIIILIIVIIIKLLKLKIRINAEWHRINKLKSDDMSYSVINLSSELAIKATQMFNQEHQWFKDESQCCYLQSNCSINHQGPSNSDPTGPPDLQTIDTRGRPTEGPQCLHRQNDRKNFNDDYEHNQWRSSTHGNELEFPGSAASESALERLGDLDLRDLESEHRVAVQPVLVPPAQTSCSECRIVIVN